MLTIQGIHHISSMVKQAQEHVDFYTNVLGLRLVKHTLNYDDVNGFHFYFGNEDASTALSTFFPMSNAQAGKSGNGQVGYYRYAIPKGTFAFWQQRLAQYGIFYFIYDRFGDKILAFTDTHGLELELVESNVGTRNTWEFNGVTKKTAIMGIDSATLLSKDIASTCTLLEDVFGYEMVAEDDEFIKLQLNEELGSRLYLNKKMDERGIPGTGTIHHIAFKVSDEAELIRWRMHLEELGYYVTEIKDRHYFKSIYFREHGGILIELATVGPGMTVDEAVGELGTHFIIPAHYQNEEEAIRQRMMPIFIRELDKLRTYNYRNRAEYEIAVKKESVLKEINRYARIEQERELDTTELFELARLRKEFIETK